MQPFRLLSNKVAAQPYIIAELGVNHDGDPVRALALAHAAAKAGANAIKLQYFQSAQLMSAASTPALYQSAAGEHNPHAMLDRLSLTIEQMAPVVHAAHRAGLHAIVTIFSVSLVEQACQLPWDSLKSASPDIIHRPLLQRLSRAGLPMIVSTGAATADEITTAAAWLAPLAGDGRLLFLQCVSAYPTPVEMAGVDVVPTIAQLTGLPAGYSDHTDAIETGANAVSYGAVMLEKHLTYDRAAAGPDHATSLNPAEFAQYVQCARAAVGMHPRLTNTSQPKQVLAIEEDVRRVSRQSIVATRNLPAGHIITLEDVTCKRPGHGLAPSLLDALPGQQLARPVRADWPLLNADLRKPLGQQTPLPRANQHKPRSPA